MNNFNWFNFIKDLVLYGLVPLAATFFGVKWSNDKENKKEERKTKENQIQKLNNYFCCLENILDGYYSCLKSYLELIEQEKHFKIENNISKLSIHYGFNSLEFVSFNSMLFYKRIIELNTSLNIILEKTQIYKEILTKESKEQNKINKRVQIDRYLLLNLSQIIGLMITTDNYLQKHYESETIITKELKNKFQAIRTKQEQFKIIINKESTLGDNDSFEEILSKMEKIWTINDFNKKIN